MGKNLKWLMMFFIFSSEIFVAGMSTLLFAATTTTYHSTDVPKGIIDLGTIRSEIVVTSPVCPATKSISDINVQLDITHTWDGDLEIWLIAPDGTQIALSIENGLNGDNYSGTVFDDEAAEMIIAGLPPFTGSYQPEGSLGGVDGGGISGTWILEIRDTFGGDTGTLNSWSLIVETIDDATYHSSDVPKEVTELPVTSVIPVCNGDRIVDLDVQLYISHPWPSDLTLTLIAPNGTRILLADQRGSGCCNYNQTTFDDEAAIPISAGGSPFTGSFRPEDPLSVINGSIADGTWYLEIQDAYSQTDPGYLLSWSLSLKTIADPYTVSTYVAGLPSEPAGLTVDPRSRTFYYSDWDDLEGTLRKISSGGNVSIVSSDFTPNGGLVGGVWEGDYYSYIFTDIQFLDGSVYVSLSEGELVRIDTKTGITTREYGFTGFGYDSGIAVKDKELLVTSGRGAAREIQLYNTKSESGASLLGVSSLTSILSVEYDPVNDKMYFWSGDPWSSAFYQADFGASTYSALPGCYFNSESNFEVSPDGDYLLAVRSSTIDLVSIADGSSSTLYQGLTSGPTRGEPRHDMVFAPSSKGAGCSLYVVEGTTILEISGFEGSCGQVFPWAMFLPAITGKTQN